MSAYLKEVPAERKAALKKLRELCRAIRYSKPERIDFSIVESMLHATVESTGPVC